MAARSLRPSRADDLGLKRALSDRLLPLLVAAMIFLAALALAGAEAASGLARHWNTGAARMIMVQVPRPAGMTSLGTRAQVVAHVLQTAAGVVTARQLTEADIAALLRPWLGQDPAQLSLPLPAVFEVTLAGEGSPASAALEAAVAQAAPGSLVERNGAWMSRLAELVRSLQACAGLALLVVTFVATAVVMVATRAGLAARRDAIDIVHSLGASDAMIARQFAARITALVLSGALLGLVLSVPVLLSLATLSAPFQPVAAAAVDSGPAALLGVLPPILWAALLALPLAAASIGWVTAQATVRGWLAELP
jgi:cell division transport system permease protein